MKENISESGERMSEIYSLQKALNYVVLNSTPGQPMTTQMIELLELIQDSVLRNLGYVLCKSEKERNLLFMQKLLKELVTLTLSTKSRTSP